jgi:uncharacterized protein
VGFEAADNKVTNNAYLCPEIEEKVMKKLIFTALFALALLPLAGQTTYTVATVPNVQLQDARRFVSNPDGILSQASVYQIDTMCYALKARDIAQVAVVVLDAVDESDLDMFAHNILNSWGVGSKKKDNGLIITIVKQQRDIQFETGYGLEGVLLDALCKRIQTVYMVPALGAGEWDKGVVDGVTAVYNVLMDNQEELGALVATEDKEDKEDKDDKDEQFAVMLILGFVVMFLLVVGLISWYQIKVTTCPVCGAKGGLHLIKREVVSRTRNQETIESTYKCRKCGHIVKRTNTHHTGGGGIILGGGGLGGGLGGFGGGRGFGGGGFGGGFGGGMSGGGGARSGF